MKNFPKAYAIIRKAEKYGVQNLENGARFLGHVPHVAPHAWLHRVYPPLQDWQRDRVELELGYSLPDAFLDFLSMTNGITLFSCALSIYGFRGDYERLTPDPWPFDIISPNEFERPKGTPESHLIIGGYTWSNGRLAMLTENGEIVVSPMDGYRALKRWGSLDEWFLAEVERLSIMFDDVGRPKEPLMPTWPA
jgi:hypothetical protein